DEYVDDGPMRIILLVVPAGGPSDDLEVVVVTVADDVTARVDESPNDVHVAGGGRPVQGVRVVAQLARVHVEPAPQQQVHGLEVPVVGRGVQQRPLVRLRPYLELGGV